jgi:hypothetical protein
MILTLLIPYAVESGGTSVIPLTGMNIVFLVPFHSLSVNLTLNFLSILNIYFSKGQVQFHRKAPGALKTPDSVRIGKFCTKSLNSFCVVFIKTFRTFLSLQNIIF